MTVLALRGVSVAYGATTVVHPVDLDVARGEWVGVIGPNGAGKSTLLRAVAGAVRSAGSITIDGLDPSPSRRLAARALAHVPQQPVIPPGMRVIDYVLLGRTPHMGLLATESRHDLEMAAATLEALHIDGLAERTMETLSGGELQRAILARALVQEAAILLLDEPTAGLDIGHQVEVFRLIDRLRRSRDLAVVSAVHDLTLAARFCDRVILMDRGSVVAAGAASMVITEDNLNRYFGPGVRVIDHPDVGIVVVPGSGDGDAENPTDGEAQDAADHSDSEVLEA